MKAALIFPPVADPTAPHIAVPFLTGWLRSHGVEVMPVDANLEGAEYLLQPRNLERCSDRIDKRLGRLKHKGILSHQQQLAYGALIHGKQFCCHVPKDIENALSILRDAAGSRFFNPVEYDRAVSVVEGALTMISAAVTPLEMDFARYRTPFSLLSSEQIQSEARADRNPYFDFYNGPLAGRLAEEKVDLVGISVIYVSQIQQAYTMAYILRNRLPGVHLTMGGPAITQMLTRLAPDRRNACLGPFDTAVLFEGETPLLEIIRELTEGHRPKGILQASAPLDLSGLPAPDFEGLPLSRYVSPALVLPYDSTRGCYWGKCAFCHYGLAEKGAAPYRERPVREVMQHIETLSARYNCRLFYLSQDVMSPKTVHRFSREIRSASRSWHWATDLRPEAYYSPEVCRDLFEGGALAVSLGIESGSQRILKRINKGIPKEDGRAAIQNMAAAGIAVEVMCFTDFPTESFAEAMETLRLLDENRTAIALFMCGRFELTSGSAVAGKPRNFGIHEVWYLAGDDFRNTLYYSEKQAPKTAGQKERMEDCLIRLSHLWKLRHYPWAGSLSTAHTLLYYDRLGPDIFKRLACRKEQLRSTGHGIPSGAQSRNAHSIVENAYQNETDLWRRLVHEKRSVSPALYRQLAEQLPPMHIR